MALIGQALQYIQDTCLGPDRGAFFKTHFIGNQVRLEESYAVNIRGQSVWVFLEKGDGIPAVFLEDLNGEGRTHAMFLEKNHDVPDLLLFVPCLPDHVYPFVADPLDFGKIINSVFDNLEGFFPKFFYNTGGHDRAYSLHEARAQIFLNALHRGRKHDPVTGHLELSPEPRMVMPLALHLHKLSGCRGDQVPHHRHWLRVFLRPHPGNRVAGLLVGIGDPLDLPLELCLGISLCAVFHSAFKYHPGSWGKGRKGFYMDRPNRLAAFPPVMAFMSSEGRPTPSISWKYRPGERRG